MVDLVLLDQAGHRLRAHHLPAAGVHQLDRQVGATMRPQHGLHHVAAHVLLRDDAIGAVAFVGAASSRCPPRRRHHAALVGEPEHVPLRRSPAGAHPGAGDHDPALVRGGVRARRGIQRHHDPLQLRRTLDPGGVDVRLSKERIRVVLEQLGVDFLATQPRSLVRALDRLEERRRQVGGVVQGGPAGDHRARAPDQPADDGHRPRCGRGDGAGARAEAQAET